MKCDSRPPPTVVVLMSGQFRLHPKNKQKKGMRRPTIASCWHYNSASDEESNKSEESNLGLLL